MSRLGSLGVQLTKRGAVERRTHLGKLLMKYFALLSLLFAFACTAETSSTSLTVEELRAEIAAANLNIGVSDSELSCLLGAWQNDLIVPIAVCNEEAAADPSRSDDECFNADFHGRTPSARAQAFTEECETLGCLDDSDGCRYSWFLTDGALGRAEACLALPCDQVDECYVGEVFCDE